MSYDAKIKPPTVAQGRKTSRRSMQISALVAAALMYLLYTSPYLTFAPDTSSDAAAQDVQAVPVSLAGIRSPAVPTDPDANLEPKIVPLQLQNPGYSVRVLRSILQHSNTSWQDAPGETQGYFMQSLLWMQTVRTR